jgi:hypothetical protein
MRSFTVSSAAYDRSVSDDDASPPAPIAPGRTRRLTRFGLVAAGVAVALYVGGQVPRDQHVRIVLGDAATEVKALDVRYVAPDGEVLREVHFTYPSAATPRVVSHESKLPNGDYDLQIDADTREGRRGLVRRVTLGGGSTQIDVSTAITREDTRDRR